MTHCFTESTTWLTSDGLPSRLLPVYNILIAGYLLRITKKLSTSPSKVIRCIYFALLHKPEPDKVKIKLISNHCRTSLRFWHLLVLQTYNLRRSILASRRFQALTPRAHFTHGTVRPSHPATHSILGTPRCIILHLRRIKPQVNTRFMLFYSRIVERATTQLLYF